MKIPSQVCSSVDSGLGKSQWKSPQAFKCGLIGNVKNCADADALKQCMHWVGKAFSEKMKTPVDEISRGQQFLITFKPTKENVEVGREIANRLTKQASERGLGATFEIRI